MIKKNIQIINIVIGILIGSAVVLLLPTVFSIQARVALGVITLMVFWWITRPVHLAVTALIPLVVNAFFEMVPMNSMLGDYASPIVLLILGASVLTAAWSKHGLDKRIAMKSLSLIGTSVRKQIIVWFLLSVVLSAFMPNMVVVAAFCPIVFSMIQFSGGKQNSKTSYLLLLAVAWGAGLGGFGTPMGGAMNLVAISNIENWTGTEFLYWQWVLNMLPYLVILSIGVVNSKIIDEINILKATFLAMKIAVKNLKKKPSYILVDGINVPFFDIPTKGIVKGDSRSISIAAASIVAKVFRDILLKIYHKIWPRYGFLENKGYGTKKHMEAIKKLGPCKIHRYSFYPVSEYGA